MNNHYSFNRLNQPRASFGAVILLILVFGLFGLWADANTNLDTDIVHVPHSSTPLIENLCCNELLSSLKISR